MSAARRKKTVNYKEFKDASPATTQKRFEAIRQRLLKENEERDCTVDKLSLYTADIIQFMDDTFGKDVRGKCGLLERVEFLSVPQTLLFITTKYHDQPQPHTASIPRQDTTGVGWGVDLRVWCALGLFVT